MKCKNSYPEDWIIAESNNYYLRGAYERAELFSKTQNKKIIDVGEHYGDTVDGIIDWNEHFCVTVGCGYIIYFIKEPFQSYMYEQSTSQWIESGRNPKNVHYYKKVNQISDTEIELTDENENVEILKISF